MQRSLHILFVSATLLGITTPVGAMTKGGDLQANDHPGGCVAREGHFASVDVCDRTAGEDGTVKSPKHNDLPVINNRTAHSHLEHKPTTSSSK